MNTPRPRIVTAKIGPLWLACYVNGGDKMRYLRIGLTERHAIDRVILAGR